MLKSAKLIIASPQSDANLYYATQFLAPDPFIYLEIDGKSIVFMSDLELDRARKIANVDRILSYSKEVKRLKSTVNLIDFVCDYLKRSRLRYVEVPENFAIAYADRLREQGFNVLAKKGLFFEHRLAKTFTEIRHIRNTLSYTHEAIQKAIDVIRKSNVRGGFLYYKHQRLTSEYLRKLMHTFLIENNCIAQQSIVACGQQSSNPHWEGKGPLKAHQPIVIDVFPQHVGSRYFADMTRTVVKGKASTRLKKMYKAVLEGQEIAFEKIHDGVNGNQIHKKIVRHFEKQGFPTRLVGKRHQGFFHGTGHGLGLEIHEPPCINHHSVILKRSNVVTIEPGLYYPDIGGVRVEDMIVVKKDGIELLSTLEKTLEID